MKRNVLKIINGKLLPIAEEVGETEEIVDNRTTQEKIVDSIRARYSIDEELAILRQRDIKKDEFYEYFEFVEHCKKSVKNN